MQGNIVLKWKIMKKPNILLIIAQTQKWMVIKMVFHVKVTQKDRCQNPLVSTLKCNKSNSTGHKQQADASTSLFFHTLFSPLIGRYVNNSSSWSDVDGYR